MTRDRLQRNISIRNMIHLGTMLIFFSIRFWWFKDYSIFFVKKLKRDDFKHPHKYLPI
jgi:hypothetical protein